MRTVREAVGDDIALMVDANQAWDAKRAIRMAHRLEKFDLTWLEEPVRHDDLESMAHVRRTISMPLCTGENSYGPAGFVTCSGLAPRTLSCRTSCAWEE